MCNYYMGQEQDKQSFPYEPAHMPRNEHRGKPKIPALLIAQCACTTMKLLLGYRDILKFDEFMGEGAFFNVLAFKVT